MDLETFAIETYEQPPQTTVLRLVGEFDLVGEPSLQEALDGLGHGQGRSLAVDVSDAPFIGVGSLRRIVLAGRRFSSTEFRSPVPIVEKVLRLLGFIEGATGIADGASPTVHPCSLDQVIAMETMENSTDSPWIVPDEWPEPRVARQCLEARAAVKHRVVDLGSRGTATATAQDAYSSAAQSLDQK